MNVGIEKMDSQFQKGRASEGEFPLKPFKLNEAIHKGQWTVNICTEL